MHHTVQSLFEEEEALLNLHMNIIQENAELLTEEGRLLQQIQGDDVIDYDIDAYATRLSEILDRKVCVWSCVVFLCFRPPISFGEKAPVRCAPSIYSELKYTSHGSVHVSPKNTLSLHVLRHLLCSVNALLLHTSLHVSGVFMDVFCTMKRRDVCVGGGKSEARFDSSLIGASVMYIQTREIMFFEASCFMPFFFF